MWWQKKFIASLAHLESVHCTLSLRVSVKSHSMSMASMPLNTPVHSWSSGQYKGWAVVMDIRYFLIYFLIYFIYKAENSTQYLSKFLLRIYFDFPKCYLLSNDSISWTMIVLTQTRTFVFPTMPYSVIMIMAMLTYRLWLCMSKCVGVFNHLFLYHFLFKYCYKNTNL